MSGSKHIAHYEQLVEWLGCDPSFHDFEVVRLGIDRRPPNGHTGPTLAVDVHVFATPGDLEADGHFRTTQHAVVSFVFYGVSAMRLETFNHQNVLSGLSVDEVQPNRDDTGTLEVAIEGCYGLDGSFRCTSGELLSIAPGIPSGSVYAKPSV